MNKNCEYCSKEFSTYRPRQKCCSRKCTTTKNNKKYNERLNKETISKITDDLPKCLICGWESRALHAHLRFKHQMTVTKYKEKFNVDPNVLYHHSYLNNLSNAIKGKNNPAYNHGGKYSPYSNKFIKYEELSEEDRNTTLNDIFDKVNETKELNQTFTTRIEYYLNKGMTEEEALIALSERQTTFSLEICIEKYGKEEGLKRWQDRQDKWHSNFKKSNYSKISQKLFWMIMHYFIEKNIPTDDIHFATKIDNGLNNEKSIKLNGGRVVITDPFV